MPFTVSHVAAVLPAHRSLRRRGLLSAAIIGSMVPDFGLLLVPIHLTRPQTHGAPALLTFCLPLGLVAWGLFQLLIKPAWCAVLPGRWRRRLEAEHPPLRLDHWRVWVAAAAAILFGALTHLIWDGFTHEGGHGVRLLPFLDAYYGPEAGGYELPLYRWLQHGSSVLGLLIVLIAIWRWSRGGGALAARPADPELSTTERRLWRVVYLILPLAMLGLAALSAWRRFNDQAPLGDALRLQIRHLASVGLAGACLSLLLVSAVVRLRVASCARRRLDA